MKFRSLLAVALAALVAVPLLGCRSASDNAAGTSLLAANTPTGQFLVGVERVGVAVVVDNVARAVANDKSLSPVESQAAIAALNDLPNVIKNPKGSAAVQAVWDAARPFLQQYSTQAKGAVVGPATLQEITDLVQAYIAALKVQETAPLPPSSPPPTTQSTAT